MASLRAHSGRVCRYTRGNPFSTRNLLLALKRHNNLYFDWADNVWRYNLTSIENDFFPEVAASTDEGDVEFVGSRAKVSRLETRADLLVPLLPFFCSFSSSLTSTTFPTTSNDSFSGQLSSEESFVFEISSLFSTRRRLRGTIRRTNNRCDFQEEV